MNNDGGGRGTEVRAEKAKVRLTIKPRTLMHQMIIEINIHKNLISTSYMLSRFNILKRLHFLNQIGIKFNFLIV